MQDSNIVLQVVKIENTNRKSATHFALCSGLHLRYLIDLDGGAKRLSENISTYSKKLSLLMQFINIIPFPILNLMKLGYFVKAELNKEVETCRQNIQKKHWNMIVGTYDEKQKIVSFKVVFITIGIIYTISYVLCVDKSYVSIERDSLFKWIYYFAVMMLGFYCKKKKRSNAQNKVSLLIVCSAMFVIFYGLQFVIKRCTVLLPFQFIIHVEEVVFIYYITYLFENLESFFIKIKHKTAISKIADSLAKITLEIYLVQMVVIDLCAEHLAFPLSFVVAVVGIYVYAIIVNSISTQVRRIVEKIVIRKKKVKI